MKNRGPQGFYGENPEVTAVRVGGSESEANMPMQHPSGLTTGTLTPKA